MAAPFSSSDEAIINEVIPLSDLTLSSSSKAQNVDVETLYDIRRVAQLLLEHRFRRVALQFPDELLCDASAVFWTLESVLKQERGAPSSSTANGDAQPIELYVLADTSYGNCCVDEVAAEHVDADVVVHFGHACLSPTSRLPCIYVFHKLPIDAADCAQRLADAFSSQSYDEHKRLVLTYDVGYEHASGQIRSALQSRLQRDVYLSQMDKDVNWTRYVTGTENGTHQEDEEDRMTVTRKNVLPDDVSHSDVVFFYVGPESLALTNLLLKLGPSTDLIRYDATANEARVDNGQTNKLLQRRYAAVQKARDAQTVGILVGTLGIRLYLPLLQQLRAHLTQTQGKRVYTISVGKLNPAKLANFQEIDVFVLIACPENSALGAHNSSRDFFRPIVTPFELLTAFKGRQWTGEYELDLERVFAQVQEADQQQRDGSDEDEDEDIPHFSLVTGGLVSSRRKQKEEQEGDGQQGAALQLRSNDDEAGVVTVRSADGSLTRVMDSAGAAHLATRSWRGLEQRLGMDEPAPLETGRTGIAKGYASGAEVRQEGSLN